MQMFSCGHHHFPGTPLTSQHLNSLLISQTLSINSWPCVLSLTASNLLLLSRFLKRTKRPSSLANRSVLQTSNLMKRLTGLILPCIWLLSLTPYRKHICQNYFCRTQLHHQIPHHYTTALSMDTCTVNLGSSVWKTYDDITQHKTNEIFNLNQTS